jgi:GNAT superfamily N-acetyltransferase
VVQETGRRLRSRDSIVIERLAEPDLDACLALAASRGWQPDRHRWQLLVEAAELHGIRDPAGGLAGCVALTRYGSGLAAVGMMLVAERFGRQGLGRRLMEHVLERAGDAVVFLYATPFGRPLYERLGFRSVGTATTSIGHFRGGAPGGTRAATPGDHDAVVALDAAALGADRGGMLRRFLASASQLRVLERDGALRGFAAASTHGDATVVGPLVAPDLGAARTLIADVAARVDGPVRLDLDDRHDGLREWAADHGVEPRDGVWLMVRGERELPGDRARLVLPMMLAAG